MISLITMACTAPPDAPASAVPPAVHDPVEFVIRLEAPSGSEAYQRILGVDPETHTAFVAIDNTRRVPRRPEMFWDVLEIDLSSGTVVDRHHTTVGQADPDRRLEFGTLWPLVDTEARFAWLASVFARIDTPMGRGSHQLALSPDRRAVVHHRYGPHRSMPDWLTVRDRDGTVLRQLGAPWGAAYRPAFSPDGASLAVTAHIGDPTGGDPYRLVLVDLASGAPRQIDGLGHAVDLRWTPDGRLYAVETDDGTASPACLREVDLHAGVAVPRVCPEWGNRLHLRLSDDGRHGVLWGHNRHRMDRGTEAVWFDLPSGEITARRGGRIQVVDLREDGVTLIQSHDPLRGDELTVLDVRSGRQASIPGLFSGGGHSRWVRGRLLLGRTVRGQPHLDLVWIDPDQALADATGQARGGEAPPDRSTVTAR